MRFVRVGALGVGLAISGSVACGRTRAVDTTGASPAASSRSPAPPAPADAGGEGSAAVEDASSAVDGAATSDVQVWSPPPSSAIDGPHQDLSLGSERPVYYALPQATEHATERPLRLVAHLHGMCGPPPYACGKWIGAGTEVGVMVCPTGNARCGDSPVGPPSWEAPSWSELVTIMDQDLETAVAKVSAKRPGTIRREGAILTGYSRGAYAAPVIARRHPSRWRHLVLIEANVPLTADGLRSAGVRSVALVAGEQGVEIAGMRKTQLDLERAGYPATLVVMPKTGHLYSENMEQVMHEALAFVLAHDEVPVAAPRDGPGR